MQPMIDIWLTCALVTNVVAFQIGGPETRDFSGMQDHASHLSSMTSMFRELAGKKIEPDTRDIVATIINSLDGNVVGALLVDKDDAQNIMDDALGAITACHDTRTIAFDTSIAAVKQNVSDLRNAHAECRRDEQRRCEHQNTTCETLDNTIKGMWYCTDAFTEETVQGRDGTAPNAHASCEHQPDETASDNKRAVDVPHTYYECNRAFVERSKDVYVRERDVCDNATLELEANRFNCTSLQDAFESEHCNWNRKRKWVCSAYTACWENGGGSFAETMAAVQAMEAQMKTQMLGLEVVKCMGNLILSGEDFTSADIDACMDIGCTACSRLDINYGAPTGLPDTSTDRTDCEVNAQDKPCDEFWTAKEYSEFEASACNDVETCKECEAEAFTMPY